MGSGGGGGGGGACADEPFYSSVGGSGGGGAGNRGGGYVALRATESVEVTGTIVTRGLSGAAGNGGTGTDGKFNDLTCDLAGSGGSGGSAGAAGASSGGPGASGFFAAGYNDCNDRQCDTYGSHAVKGGNGGGRGAGAGGGVLVDAPSVTISGTIDALGGGPKAVNGGTVKIFHGGAAPATDKIKAGKVAVFSL